jgi:hypothetical protein
LGIKETIRGFLDKIFEPPISFLEMCIEKLQEIQLVTAQGLNVGQYLSIFGDMPKAWQLVVSSLLTSCVLLGALLIVRSIMRMYFATKEGVKWW